VGGVQMKQYERFVLREQGVVLTHLFDPKDAEIQHQEAVAQLLVERCSDLFRFIHSKETTYQKAVVSVCQDEADQARFKRLIVLACLDNDMGIMDSQVFVAAKQRVRETLVDQAKKIAIALESAKTRERQLKQRLSGKIPPAWLNPIAAMKTHLADVSGNILSNTPPDRMIDLDRYLCALEMRLEKLQSRLLLDAQWQQEIDQVESGLKQLWPTYPSDWRSQDHKLVELRWQIEEFRVLCFAQTLKTRDKVSFKRLSNALREYREL
jgi:ATP-dependent helicase HrpA